VIEGQARPEQEDQAQGQVEPGRQATRQGRLLDDDRDDRHRDGKPVYLPSLQTEGAGHQAHEGLEAVRDGQHEGGGKQRRFWPIAQNEPDQ
jgi:hypothetical protein